LVLGAGVITWATRRDPGRGTHAATGVTGALAPAGSSTTLPVIAGAPGSSSSTAAGGTPTTEPSRPVRVTAGPGTVTVSWDAVQSRPAVQSYVVRATEQGTGDHGTLVVCGTCTSATFRGLTNGNRYTFVVSGQTASGTTAPLQSPAAVPSSPLCPPGQPCVAVDAGTPTGTASGRMQGFLHGIDGYTNRADIAALEPTTWRGSPGQHWHDLVSGYGVQTTEVLSDDWDDATYDKDKGGAAAPWDDWNAYRSYVTNFVQRAESQGWAPTYWEILNEPDAGLPYYPGANASIDNTLQTYLNGYQAIKAADPQAKVIGPSTLFTVERLPNHPELLDLTTFLDFANAHGMRLDAISWHETGPGHLPAFDQLPDSIANHVDRIRDELFRWPNIGKPQIFVNEYGTGQAIGVPGWRVAYLAALENAGTDGGNASCWALDNNDPAGCANPTLGGLLDKDESTPRASYWVHRAYADMRGTRLDSSTSLPFFSAFAVAQGGSGPWEVMLGRHQSCTSPANSLCSQPASAVPAPVPVVVAIRVGGPDRTLTLSLQRIPDATGPMPDAPPTSSQPVVVKNGVVRFTTPPFADGEAYVLRLG
ncbi:MAG: fibronectin type III domain-containing protein, partial [Acidimicrobiia bacterium]|nr:fibronectin type III domain-containing protein [Acidimicrobiia bacterium]